MNPPPTPHDELFREMVSQPDRALALFKDYLPSKVASLLDLSTPPEALEGSFVDAAARSQCDALFRVKLRTGHDARIFLLLEHKSRVDARTPLQILKYMVNIWQRESTGRIGDRLPPIIPMVFFHGSSKWTVPRSVPEMIDAPDALRPWLREFAYILHDLGEIEPQQLSGSPEVRAGLLALREVHAVEIRPDVLDLITSGPVAESPFEGHIFRYLVRYRSLTQPMLEASLRRTNPDRWEGIMGTIAETWLKQGEARGEARGRAAGRAEALENVLVRQLELRFGRLPNAAHERIRAASIPALEAWADAVPFAANLEEVMTARPAPLSR